MVKKFVLAIVISAFAFTGVANAACSDEELEKKADAFTEAVAAAGQKDPARMGKIMQEIQGDMEKAQNANDDSNDAMCKFYDEAAKKFQF